MLKKKSSSFIALEVNAQTVILTLCSYSKKTGISCREKIILALPASFYLDEERGIAQPFFITTALQNFCHHLSITIPQNQHVVLFSPLLESVPASKQPFFLLQWALCITSAPTHLHGIFAYSLEADPHRYDPHGKTDHDYSVLFQPPLHVTRAVYRWIKASIALTAGLIFTFFLYERFLKKQECSLQEFTHGVTEHNRHKITLIEKLQKHTHGAAQYKALRALAARPEGVSLHNLCNQISISIPRGAKLTRLRLNASSPHARALLILEGEATCPENVSAFIHNFQKNAGKNRLILKDLEKRQSPDELYAFSLEAEL